MEHMIDKVAVIGAGTMGAGIAELCIKAGLETTLVDVTDELLNTGVARLEGSLKKAVEKGKLADGDATKARARLRTATDIAKTNADLVIEAVYEDIALKKKIFGEGSARLPKALWATNTSSLSVTEIAAATATPSNVLGLHFFNPPPIMPLLEIVRAEQTAEDVIARALTFAKAIGKTPIVVRDYPGFATSRLGIILGMEAIRMLEAGVASAEDIDRAMELGYKHPMGPLKLTDLVGLDVRLAIAEHLTRELGPQFSPPPLLRQLVRAGKLGKKTGEGFYRWNGDEAVAVRR
jgi:3-hydroxybutyryl-CoA dehydrogenase